MTSLRGNPSIKKSGSSVSVPPTKIPEQFHLKTISGTPPTDPDVKAEYDEKSKMWKTTIFPSLRPSGRQEVLLLDKWLNDMLADNLSKNQDPIESVKEAQTLYSQCFHEICRQVYVQCAERGKLMEKIWNRYLQLFEHILKIREREKFSQTQKLEQQKSVYQRLYKEKDEKFNKAYLQLAADKEKITMSKDKLERAVLVLQEEYKKRVKRENTLKKALKKVQQQMDRMAIPKPSLADSLMDQDRGGSPDWGEDGRKRVRINDAQLEMMRSFSSAPPTRASLDLYDSPDENDPMHKIVSGLSLASMESFSKFVEEEEEEEEEKGDDILNSEDIDFSNSNLILVNKLEFITKSLRSIHKMLAVNPGEDTYSLTQQLGSVLEAIGDAISLMEHPELMHEKKTSAQPQVKTLSTMFALRAPMDKAVQTMDIEVVENVPKPFVQYFAKSFKVPVVHPKDRRWVFACISYVYAQKVQHDAECDIKNLPHVPLPQFVYEVFIHIFGIRAWAEMHLLDFLGSLRRYIQMHLRMKMFTRFLGMAEELYSPYTPYDLNFYLFVLGQFQISQEKYLLEEGPPAFRESKDGNRTISVKTAKALIPIAFPDIEAQVRDSIVRVIESSMHVDEFDGITQAIDMDKFLEVLVEEYHLHCNLISDRFTKTLEDSVSAPLPDNMLLFDEFLSCMNYFNSSISESDVLSIYREILENSASLNSVEIPTVLSVLSRRSLFRWRSYPSKVDRNAIEEYLLQFMEVIWESTKADILDKIKRTQLDGTINPRVSSQAQERVRAFQAALANGAPRSAMGLYRQVLEQLFFALKKQSRVIMGERALHVDAPQTPTSPLFL